MTDFRVIEVATEDELRQFNELPNSLYSAEILSINRLHESDEKHLHVRLLLLSRDKAVGRLVIYLNPNLQYQEEKTACIGSYEIIDEQEASNILLQYAKQLVTREGVKWIIGPMEGSTWNSYRFSNSNEQPNFFMEPYHHTYYNRHFTNSGWKTAAQYFSQVDKELVYNLDEIKSYEQDYRAMGAAFRNLEMDNLDKDLHQIAEFSNNAFSNNFLFSPISPEDFVAKYKKLASLMDPNLVWIVEDEASRIHALLFAIKDHYDSTGQTIIIKSMARLKDSRFLKIGRYMLQKTNHLAHSAGYTKIIHAFMIQDNASLAISEANTEIYKSYQLYVQKL